MTPAEIAAACLADEIKPLEAADQLLRAYQFLPGQPIWAVTGGPQGPLTALYKATDEIDRLGYIGNDADWWHVSVREAKRVELVEAQLRMEQPVKAACRAIIAAIPPIPPFFDIETAALQAIFDEIPEFRDTLRKQFEMSSVTKRENTGGGFLTTIAVPDSAQAVTTHQLLGYETEAHIDHLRHGLGFALVMKEGRLHVLDGYSLGGENTSDLDFARIGFSIRKPVLKD